MAHPLFRTAFWTRLSIWQAIESSFPSDHGQIGHLFWLINSQGFPWTRPVENQTYDSYIRHWGRLHKSKKQSTPLGTQSAPSVLCDLCMHNSLTAWEKNSHDTNITSYLWLHQFFCLYVSVTTGYCSTSKIANQEASDSLPLHASVWIHIYEYINIVYINIYCIHT